METKIKQPEMLLEIESADMNDILSIIHDLYGFDMSQYSSASLRRRFIRLMNLYGFSHVFELKHAIVNQEISYQKLVNELTVNVTEMFRHAHFYKSIRETVIPFLATFPAFKIWHAGCSTGEEMYSLAILLKEAGLLSRAKIYGTDINSEALKVARKGIYDLGMLRDFTRSYQESGGTEPFSNYYTAHYDSFKMDPELSANMTICQHNLVHDGVFNEFQLILNRNVLIYFNRELQARVTRLFEDSLAPYGFLAIGSRDPFIDKYCASSYSETGKRTKIYQKQGL